MKDPLIDKDILESERQALLSVAIVTETDIEGRITFVNDNFIKTFKYKREEILGKTHKMINSQFHSSKFFEDLWKTLKKNKVWTGLIRDVTKKGDRVWLNSAIMPIYNKKGNFIKYMSVSFDMTPYLED